MPSQPVGCKRNTFVTQIGKALLVVAQVFVAIDSARAVDFSVGAPEVIYTKAQRVSKHLSTWPDGTFGVLPAGNGLYDFYGANGSKPVKTTGPLTNPAKSKKSVNITNLPRGKFDYVAGGPVYLDPASGARLMIYHAETHDNGARKFHSMLGMAVSTDAEGRTFRDLGTIVEPNLQSGLAEVGGGTFAVMGSYMNVYFRDWLAGGGTTELAVARAPLADLVSNALLGKSTDFKKYYNGDWTQPGRGGNSSPLEVGNPNNGWMAVSFNDYLNQLVMVSSHWTSPQPDLYMTTSSDGINWAPKQALVTDPGEQIYTTIIGTGPDPQHSGKSFYVYYSDSMKGEWSRPSDAKLMRREITLDPSAPPIINPGGSTPPPPPLGWAQIADYASDFQSGGPAQGWRYAWNPTGTLGNMAAYSTLVWSDLAQAYNTTGAATTVPTKTSHHDDYLSLSATGGHPGNSKYMAIAGYTIQAEDGAGTYRLTDSLIRKVDGTTEKKEDGLQIMVYVNNLKSGVAQAVSTNGLAVNFNRDLGQLNVGDTVWVMIDPLKNQLYDSFTGFDFSIQKSVPIEPLLALGTSAVPEPGTATLLVMALACLGIRPPRRSC